MSVKLLAAVVAAMSVVSAQVQAVTIVTVPVGDIGNPNDSTGFGAVAYPYNMGKYDVTNAQYAEFLNAKAASSDPYHLWNSSMTSDPEGGINRSGTGPYTYTVKAGQANQPVVDVTWYNTIRFANWLTNGQQSGDTETGTYIITGSAPTWTVAVPNASQRATWAAGTNKTYWLLPSENEWYKAAFYKGGSANAGYWTYATQSNSPPTSEPPPNPPPGGSSSANYYSPTTGYALTHSTVQDSSLNYLTDVGSYPNSVSPYGTLDQDGDVWQWNEAVVGAGRCWRGGSWEDGSSDLASSSGGRGQYFAQFGVDIGGFRVASVGVPEPGSLALLLGMAGMGLLYWRRHGLHL